MLKLIVAVGMTISVGLPLVLTGIAVIREAPRRRAADSIGLQLVALGVAVVAMAAMLAGQ